MNIQFQLIPLVVLTLLIGNLNSLGLGAPSDHPPVMDGSKLLADCPPVANTPNFTFAYGTAVVNGQPAPIGSLVTAKSPRGDIVGCIEVSSSGYYGAMYIYGEDTSVTPNIPGMRAGETVMFYLDNLPASAIPTLVFASDRDLHEVNLTATGEAAPAADFSATPTSGNAPLLVSFTNLTLGTATSWLWTFGDGATSTAQNPTHTYSTKGVYTVSLQATNGAGSSTRTRTDYISVYNAAVANFTATPTSGIAPYQVNFSNTSSGDFSSSSWSFGDGGTSTELNPAHTYSTPGVYTVSLTVSGSGGTDTETKTSLISVYQAVQAEFSASQTHGIAPLTVSFSNLSTGDYTTIHWNFGDGGTSTDPDPSHTYLLPGTYTVVLTVSGNGGEDVETKIGLIQVDYGIYLPLIVR